MPLIIAPINVALAGNTAGTLQTISSGMLTLAGGPNVTLSQVGQAISISAPAGGAGTVSSATTVSSVATANVVGADAGRYALEGHQHGGIPLVSVVGNTAGNTTQGNLSLVLGGGPNITLSGATAAGVMTLSVNAAAAGGGATLSGFEPFYMANPISTTYLPAIGSWFFQPFVAPQAIGSGRLNILVSMGGTSNAVLRASTAASFVSNTTGTVSVHQSIGDSYALYSRGAGANSTRIESFWSNTWSMRISNSVSVTQSTVLGSTTIGASQTATMVYIGAVGSDGGYTSTSLSSSRTASTTGGASLATSLVQLTSMMNRLTGMLLLPYGFNTSIAAGHYWFAQAFSSSSTTGGTAAGDQWPVVNQVGLYGLTSMPHRPFAATVSNTSSQYWPGAGVYSATSGVPPSLVPFTDIRSRASHITDYFNIVNITHGQT